MTKPIEEACRVFREAMQAEDNDDDDIHAASWDQLARFPKVRDRQMRFMRAAVAAYLLARAAEVAAMPEGRGAVSTSTNDTLIQLAAAEARIAVLAAAMREVERVARRMRNRDVTAVTAYHLLLDISERAKASGIVRD